MVPRSLLAGSHPEVLIVIHKSRWAKMPLEPLRGSSVMPNCQVTKLVVYNDERRSVGTKDYLEYRLKNTDARPAYETLEIGTPLDYTSDVYRVYFEILDSRNEGKRIISDFIGRVRSEKIVTLTHGYEVELPIQCVPDVVRLLISANIAVYQVVRYAKTNGTWA